MAGVGTAVLNKADRIGEYPQNNLSKLIAVHLYSCF